MRQTEQQRRAIVMGATSGIGLEVARILAAQGWKVGIAGRRTGRLEQLAALTDGGIESNHQTGHSQSGIIACRQIDVNAEDAPERLQELIDALGGMDLYFHSSGIGWQNNGLDIQKELLTVETNALGFTRMVATAFNYFASRPDASRRPCQVACISSIAGTKGLGAAPAYSATKRFQNHYLECLSQQAGMRHLPIRITDIRPGFVTTDLIAGSTYPLQLSPEAVAKHIVHAINRKQSVATIDWRYRILVFFWRLIPRWLWVRLPIGG